MTSERNHIELVLALIVVSTFCIIPLIACYLAGELWDENILMIIFLIILAFVSLPLFSGIFRMIGRAYQNKEHGLIDIFFAFSSFKSYLKVLFMNFITFLKFATPLSVGFIAYTVSAGLLGNTFHNLAKTVGGILMGVSLLLFLPLCHRLYSVVYFVTVEDMGVIKAIICSWRNTKRKSLSLIYVNFSLLPLTILSVAALLVPFVIYTFPYLMCVYTLICEKLSQEDQIENIINKSQNDICPEDTSEGVEEINEQDS